MKLHLIAVGTRMPDWVESGFRDYQNRMPRDLPLILTEVKAEPRTTGKTVPQMMQAEQQRLEAALANCGSHVRVVVLDERGEALDTRTLSQRMERWQSSGDDVALIIGGPDGLSDAIKARAHEKVRLSSLTLPHALVRVLVAEALYRAHSLLINHPYHRD